ncbi:nucleotidyltransferase family protein [Candidatus Poribacteria bacterium]|nr:nucleotidyltransferase family protein [Candidatus Poribacteria bacterium]
MLDALRSAQPGWRARYPIARLSLFGSYARGEQTDASDVDLIVEFDGKLSLFQFIALEQEMAGQLGVRVDLVEREAMKPRIRVRAEKEEVPL